MVLKKKEIIAAALVVLIGTAGYLNWSYQDTMHVTDGESYIETGKKLGEAQYVNSTEEVEETDGNKNNAENSDENEQTEGDKAANKDANEGENKENTGAVVETATDTGGYFDKAKYDRESARAKSLEILNQTAENSNFDEEIRKKAGDQIITAASNVEKETEIESIAQSKGYSEICVYIDENGVNLMVRKEGFSDKDVVKLTDIVTDELDISAKNIKIIEVR